MPDSYRTCIRLSLTLVGLLLTRTGFVLTRAGRVFLVDYLVTLIYEYLISDFFMNLLINLWKYVYFKEDVYGKVLRIQA